MDKGLINMTVVPLEKDFLLPYGIFHRPQPSPATRRFLDFIELTYGAGNASGIVRDHPRICVNLRCGVE